MSAIAIQRSLKKFFVLRSMARSGVHAINQVRIYVVYMSVLRLSILYRSHRACMALNFDSSYGILFVSKVSATKSGAGNKRVALNREIVALN